ncbi:MAG: DUF362 domain-containing protein [Deltaproteobacteria bacterium]|nr:DUF362 domain-containing protein [Deltaproteobacteria bacterium]
MTNEKKNRDKPKNTSKKITRRRVLIGTGVALGAGALGVGGYMGYGFNQRFARGGAAEIPDHRVAAGGKPQMVVVHGPSPAKNVHAAIARMGGMSRFVNSSDVVLVKPNIGWLRTPAHAANTHPEAVAQVVRECVAARAKKVIVCDCPVDKARDAFRVSGIAKAALEAGARVILPEESGYQTVKISERLGVWDVLTPFVEATKIINVPVAKHHSLTGVTAGMKNWIGITTKLRMHFHNDIHRSIAELARLMRPTLTVMDGTRVLMAKGPKGGSLSDVKSLNTIAVSVDPVAIDAWAHSLFGLTPDEYPESIHLAHEFGLGTFDIPSISPVELQVDG